MKKVFRYVTEIALADEVLEPFSILHKNAKALKPNKPKQVQQCI